MRNEQDKKTFFNEETIVIIFSIVMSISCIAAAGYIFDSVSSRPDYEMHDGKRIPVTTSTSTITTTVEPVPTMITRVATETATVTVEPEKENQ